MLAVVCKCMRQLPTMLGPTVLTVHCGKDTTHKTLLTMCNASAWPQQCWESCANGSNIVALHFSNHGTKEMKGVFGFVQQHETTCNGMQMDATCNIQQHWELSANHNASVCMGLYSLINLMSKFNCTHILLYLLE